jgi:hypothetical protein
VLIQLYCRDRQSSQGWMRTLGVLAPLHAIVNVKCE